MEGISSFMELSLCSNSGSHRKVFPHCYGCVETYRITIGIEQIKCIEEQRFNAVEYFATQSFMAHAVPEKVTSKFVNLSIIHLAYFRKRGSKRCQSL